MILIVKILKIVCVEVLLTAPQQCILKYLSY
nr:MAG TPA: hypothetical protein [Bacteriophage sp.]